MKLATSSGPKLWFWKIGEMTKTVKSIGDRLSKWLQLSFSWLTISSPFFLYISRSICHLVWYICSRWVFLNSDLLSGGSRLSYRNVMSTIRLVTLFRVLGQGMATICNHRDGGQLNWEIGCKVIRECCYGNPMFSVGMMSPWGFHGDVGRIMHNPMSVRRMTSGSC